MASLIGFVLGACLGALIARQRGGNLLDILQYAAIFGIVWALVILFGSITALRLNHWI
jgi:hypothetical protein